MEWKTYHENLAIIGALPENGDFQFDAGFVISNSSDLSKTDGDLENHISNTNPGIFNKKECATYNGICLKGEAGGCSNQIQVSCSLKSTKKLSQLNLQTTFTADEDSFKTAAGGELDGQDYKWCMDHKKQFVKLETNLGTADECP